MNETLTTQKKLKIEKILSELIYQFVIEMFPDVSIIFQKITVVNEIIKLFIKMYDI